MSRSAVVLALTALSIPPYTQQAVASRAAKTADLDLSLICPERTSNELLKTGAVNAHELTPLNTTCVEAPSILNCRVLH